jgi:plastocyanin
MVVLSDAGYKTKTAKFYYYKSFYQEQRDYVIKYILTNDISGESFGIIHLQHSQRLAPGSSRIPAKLHSSSIIRIYSVLLCIHASYIRRKRRADDKLNKIQSLLASSLIALSLASTGLVSLFKDVYSSVTTGSPAEFMQPSMANDSTSNAATDIFSSKQYTLSYDNILSMILIPNEGHHGPGEDDEARFIAQSFVPETAAINKGTNVIWFNGDVGHEHDIIVTSNSDSVSPIYQTGEFTEFEARNYTFYDVGEFSYADTVEYDNGYIMRGNISVTDDSGSADELPQTTEDSETVGILIVPTQDISQYTSDLQNRGFRIDSMHNFQDLRGGQSGTGDEQTLIVWRTPTNMQSSSALSQLSEFSTQLPYS